MSHDSRPPLVVVANRLPVERAEDGGWVRAPGGLVSALAPIVRGSGGAWVGWDGSSDGTAAPFRGDNIDLIPIPLGQHEVEAFYEGFSNATLWPLFHDVIAKPQFDRGTWAAYREVNQRFVDRVAEAAAPSATVWVHDYQLTLVPAGLRAVRPDLTIGFFNHIPFPPYEIFSQLPWEQEIVAGMLGADLLGFQRQQDANNFLRACRRAHRLRTEGDRLVWQDPSGFKRRVTARSYPIGVEVSDLQASAHAPETDRLLAQYRSQVGDRTVLLGVDRLDYTKGIPVRLRAVGELLSEGRLDPEKVVYVQVATPSRERVEAYQELRDDIELAVGRINGSHSTLSTQSVVYLRSTVGLDELVALYRLADVMMVTPLRDGMNLVAKEYVVSRGDETGVLILSRFAGAADSLTEAIIVNPYDLDGVKQAILTAVRMPRSEQQRRMHSLRHEVLTHDVRNWADSFLGDLRAQAQPSRPESTRSDQRGWRIGRSWLRMRPLRRRVDTGNDPRPSVSASHSHHA